MPAPLGTDPNLAQYLADKEVRLENVENPQQPVLGYATTSAKLTTANAKTFINCVVIVIDLKTLAYSTGAHWINAATGANII